MLLSKVISLKPFSPYTSSDEPPLQLNAEVYTGIEFELEGLSESTAMDTNAVKYWNVIDDSSLRGTSSELVMKKPAKGRTLEKIIDLFYVAIIEEFDTYIVPSFRTSTHIHINVRDMELKHLLVMYLNSIFMEPLLHRYFPARPRSHSVFCTPTMEARKTIEGINKIVEGIKYTFKQQNVSSYLHSLASDNNRYGAINPASILKHGTLEYRMFPLMKRPQDLINVLNILYSIYKSKNKVYTINNPKNIDKFLAKNFGPESEVLANIPNYKSLIMQGAAYVEYILSLSDYKRELNIWLNA